MTNRLRKTAVTALASAGLLAGGAVAAPAAFAQPLVTGGLVNVTVTDIETGDILSENQVSLGAALGIAANICDVNVNVLAQQLRDGGATCDSEASGQQVDIEQTN